MKLPSFDNWDNGELSKIGIMILKNVNNKNCTPKFVFFKGKKIRKIQMIFDIQN